MPDQFSELPDRVRAFLESLRAKPIPLAELPDEYRNADWLNFCCDRGWVAVTELQYDHWCNPLWLLQDTLQRECPGAEIWTPYDVGQAQAYQLDRADARVSLTDAGQFALTANRLARELREPAQSHEVQLVDGQSCDAGPVQSHNAELPDDAYAAMSGEARALAVLTEHPDWTDAKIAEAAKVNRTSLYRFDRYTKARAALQDAAPRANDRHEGRTGKRLRDTSRDTLRDTSDDNTLET